jgi:hypothetical protein
VPDGAPIRRGTLPAGARDDERRRRAVREHTTRGLLVTPDAAATIVVEDWTTPHQRTVTVWPSGQVAPA